MGISMSREAIHRRLRNTRGKASEYVCVDCGKAALDWSWIHGLDPTDLESYEPRCRSCHKTYDEASSYFRGANPSVATPEFSVGTGPGNYTNGSERPPGPRRKLTDADVRRICVERAYGKSVRSLATELGVTNHAIRSVLSGRTWSHITGNKRGH